MKIVLDKNGAEPLNEQIRIEIMRSIADGSIKPDECLPSIRTVARTLGVGVITVKTAYEKLEADGFIYTVAGKGCFASPERENGNDTAENIKTLALSRLKPAVDYCKSLGLSEKDITSLVKELCDKG